MWTMLSTVRWEHRGLRQSKQELFPIWERQAVPGQISQAVWSSDLFTWLIGWLVGLKTMGFPAGEVSQSMKCLLGKHEDLSGRP